MVLITLRAADEVCSAGFGAMTDKLDPEMVAVARTIIEGRAGSFDPSTFRDHYREALQELIEAKLKAAPSHGLPCGPRPGSSI